MPRTRLAVLTTLCLWVAAAGAAWAAGPADGLLRLVPPDAGVTLAVENLRAHAHEFCDSPLADGLKQLPAVQAWRVSDRHRALMAARAEIERALDVPIETIAEQLLGDAVVLAMHVAPGDQPADAHGLLLLRFSDRGLVDRLIDRLNAREKKDGALRSVEALRHREATYWVRKFAPGGKPPEYYTIVGNVFAWSNSEAVIQGVVDRKAGAPGLADQPRFRQVRGRLPERAVASLFLNPRFVERMMAADTRRKAPAEQRVSDLLARNLRALAYAGAALEWRDGLVLHTEETIDPEKLDEPLRHWAGQPGGATAPLLVRVPPTALAVAAGNIDFGAVYDVILGLAADIEPSRLANGLQIIRGIFLGKDLRSEILPSVGPGALLYVDHLESEPVPAARFPLVAAVNLDDPAGGEGVGAAVENGLRTLLAAYALDAKQREARLRPEPRQIRGVSLTALVGASARPVFAFAVQRGMLVCGTSAEAVASYCAASAQPPGGTRFDRFRAAYFPKAESFAFVDLPRLHRLADAHREGLARRMAARNGTSESAARRDLDQALALINLFEGAYFTSSIERDFSAVHRTLGLIARERPSAGGESPAPR